MTTISLVKIPTFYISISGGYRDRMSPQYSEPRLVYPVMKKSGDLGVRLVGGNAVGIFIHSVDIDSPAYNVGLRSADQILEYNGTDLRNVFILKIYFITQK